MHQIRKSKFLIADFTGQRGGVYYEAGFAYGLGLPVIWTCRKDWFDGLVHRQALALADDGEEHQVNIGIRLEFILIYANITSLFGKWKVSYMNILRIVYLLPLCNNAFSNGFNACFQLI